METKGREESDGGRESRERVEEGQNISGDTGTDKRGQNSENENKRKEGGRAKREGEREIGETL